MPKVSVLMSVYNRAAYVGEALESVLQQTYSDWELVVVNDGSQDNSEEVIKQYQSQLTYMAQPNRGMSSGLNRAFRESTGDYIAFLSSDDMLLPDSLETLASFLDENPTVGMVHSDGYVCDEYGENFDKFSSYVMQPRDGNMFEQLAVDNNANIVDSALTRRTWLEQMEGPFDEEMHGFEDWDLVLRLIVAGCEFRYLDVPTFKYRVHTAQKSSPKSSISERRRQSLLRTRLKLIEMPEFLELPITIRRHVFYITLVDLLRGNALKQGEVLQSVAFTSLPEPVQGDLLYYVGVDNILDGGQTAVGRERLERASKLAPGNSKIRLASTLSGAGRLPLALLIRPRRALHRLLKPEVSYLPTGQKIQAKRQAASQS